MCGVVEGGPWSLYGSEGSALTLPLFLLSLRTIMLCHFSSTMTKDHFLVICYGTKWPLFADVPLNPQLFIHSATERLLKLISSQFWVSISSRCDLSCWKWFKTRAFLPSVNDDAEKHLGVFWGNTFLSLVLIVISSYWQEIPNLDHSKIFLLSSTSLV